MAKLICNCPACGSQLKIAVLHCENCGMELKNNFELSPFELLNSEQREFLISFLKQRGNLHSLQKELDISYLTAKKRLENLLTALNLIEVTPTEYNEGEFEMKNWSFPKDSNKASDIIRQKLAENNGRVIVNTLTGLPCEIRAASDGVSFLSDKLPIKPPYRYEVFDIIVDLLISQGGRARKGNGRNYKLGDSDCDETTVVGAVGYHYAKKETGDSVFDPVFVLAAVLEWAGIAKNERGELVLTADYQSRLSRGETAQ